MRAFLIMLFISICTCVYAIPDTTIKASNKDTIPASKKHLNESGTQFCDTCPPVLECCETALIPDTKNSKKQPINYILQKNFADIKPFAFREFKIYNGKGTTCIRLCNINRMAFDIVGSEKIEATTLSDSNLFDNLSKTFGTAAKNKIPDAKIDSSPKVKFGEIIQSNHKKKKITKETITNTAIYLQQKIEEYNKEIIEIAKKLDAEEKKLNQFARFAKNAQKIVEEEPSSQQKIKNNLSKEANIKAFHGTSFTYEELPNIINNDVYQVFIEMKKDLEDINDAKEKMENAYEELKKFCNAQNSLSGKIMETCEGKESLTVIPKAVQNAIDIATKADETELTTAIQSINTLLAKVNDDNNFYFQYCSQQAEGDFLDLSIKYSPKPSMADRYKTDSFYRRIPIRDRFKWAIGPALNFHLTKSLFDDSYRIDSIHGTGSSFRTDTLILKDTFGISKNPSRNKLIPAVGVMVHFYWQTHNALTPGIAIGLSTSPTDLASLRAYLGGSLIIGALKGKLIFSAGLAGGSVDRLLPNLIEGKNYKNQIPYNGDTLGSPNQLVEKVFRVGMFFGMTYNLKD